MKKILKVLECISEVLAFVILSELLIYYKNKYAYGALLFASFILVILCIKFMRDDKNIVFLVLICIYLIVVSIAVILGVGLEELDVKNSNQFIKLIYIITYFFVAQSPRIIFAVYGLVGIFVIWAINESHLGRLSTKCIHSVRIKRDRVYLYPDYENKIYNVFYMQGHKRKKIGTLPFEDSSTNCKAYYSLKWINKEYCEVNNMADKKSEPIRFYLKKHDVSKTVNLYASNDNRDYS